MKPWWMRDDVRAPDDGGDGSSGDAGGGGGSGDGSGDGGDSGAGNAGGSDGGQGGDGGSGGTGLFAGADAGGNGGDGTGGDGTGHPAVGSGSDDGGAAAAAAAAAAGDGPAQRPEYLPEAFWDADKGEPRVEQLSKALTDTKAALTKAQQQGKLDKNAPEDADAYLKDWKMPAPGDGQALDRIGEIPADDPALKAMAAIAHKNGFSQERFENTIVEFLASINEHMPAPPDMAAEREKLGGDDAAKTKIGSSLAWLKSLAPLPNDGEEGRTPLLTNGEFAALEKLGATADGVTGLLKLREMSGEKPIPLHSSTEAGGVKTPEEVYALQGAKDDQGRIKYDVPGPAGDAYRAMVDAEFAKTFGSGRGNFSGRVTVPGGEGNA